MENEQFDDIMIDLETLATEPGAQILSIGAVAFRPGRALGPEFYTAVNMKNSASLGFLQSAATMKWWTEQSEEARQLFDEADSDAAPMVVDALRSFASYCQLITGARGRDAQPVRIWGNGAGFDNAILATAYNRVGIPTPWKGYQDRCYRTLKNIVEGPVLRRIGTFHNALDDAKSQALHANVLLSRLSITQESNKHSHGKLDSTVW